LCAWNVLLMTVGQQLLLAFLLNQWQCSLVARTTIRRGFRNIRVQTMNLSKLSTSQAILMQSSKVILMLRLMWTQTQKWQSGSTLTIWLEDLATKLRQSLTSRESSKKHATILQVAGWKTEKQVTSFKHKHLIQPLMEQN
jgi:hypothetical protein